MTVIKSAKTNGMSVRRVTVYINFVKTYLCFVCVHFSQPEYAAKQHSGLNSILRILTVYKILSVSHF